MFTLGIPTTVSAKALDAMGWLWFALKCQEKQLGEMSRWSLVLNVNMIMITKSKSMRRSTCMLERTTFIPFKAVGTQGWPKLSRNAKNQVYFRFQPIDTRQSFKIGLNQLKPHSFLEGVLSTQKSCLQVLYRGKNLFLGVLLWHYFFLGVLWSQFFIG